MSKYKLEFCSVKLYFLRNYFIIEKDTSIIKSIKNVMEKCGGYNCLGISDDYESALNTILSEPLNLVFFNVDNVISHPFNLVQEVNELIVDVPDFIAISCFKEKSYEALKYGFIDILLQPVPEIEIRKSVLKYQKKKPIGNNQKVCLKSYKDFQYLEVSEILFLRGDNNTTEFYMENGKVINSFKTLKTYENLLPSNFSRIHKSFIINKNFVSRIQFGKSICTIKPTNYDIPFSKTYLNSIENLNSLLSQYSIKPLS